MYLINSQQSRQLDQLSEQFDVSVKQLMQNAGRAVADSLKSRVAPGAGIAFFIGKGNNGGDGLVAADILARENYDVILLRNEADLKTFAKKIEKASWIVDALLGTGLSGEPRGWCQEAIAVINRLRKNGKKVLSIDVPSGLSADKGLPMGIAVTADVTLALGFAKLGEVLYPGLEFAGRVEVVDIGIPKKGLEKIDLRYHLLGPNDFKSHFKPRSKETHKKDCGHVLIVGGSKEMPGAGYLASLGALRSGAGMATYCLPQDAFEKFESQYPEVMTAPADFSNPESVLRLCEKKEALVLGPGLGRDPKTFAFVKTLLENVSLPIVLDADGLMAIADAPMILKKRKAPTILTPHPGEMAALIGSTTDEVQKNRMEVAQESADLWKVVTILKGCRSLVAFADGHLYVNPTGNPGMATAGTGDVLAGMIGGFLAQGLSPEMASLAGVYLHGLAGDMAAEEKGQKGLIASDVLGYVPKVIRLIEQAR